MRECHKDPHKGQLGNNCLQCHNFTDWLDGTGVLVRSPKGLYRARYVVLALGKSGSPRKLGVKGEELPNVMYRLIEADHYVNKRILVVGAGDSAVEAAMGLGHQVGNQVILSYASKPLTTKARGLF